MMRYSKIYKKVDNHIKKLRANKQALEAPDSLLGVLVTVEKKPKVLGRLRRAPENFVTQQFADDVYENGLDEQRRGF